MAQVGSAVRVRVDIYDIDTGALTDPAVGVYITIVDEEGTVVVDNQGMDKLGTGRYQYVWQSAGTNKTGPYEVTINDDDGTYQYVADRQYFILT